MIPGLEKTSTASSMRRLKEAETMEQAIGRAARLPPVANVDFRNENPKINNATVHTHEMHYSGKNWVMTEDGSYLQFETEFSPLKNRKYYLDLYSYLTDPENLSSVTIEVNGNVITFDPSNERSSIDITDFLQDGNNTVKITFQGPVGSEYEVQAFAIQAR